MVLEVLLFFNVVILSMFVNYLPKNMIKHLSTDNIHDIPIIF